MANANKPQGFELTTADGKQYRTKSYIKKTGTAIYRGDAVQMDGAGNIVIATTSGAILGIALESKAATSIDEILICDDPDAVFEAMVDGAFAAADIHQNIDLVVGSGDSARSVSGMYLNYGAKDTTSTRQFRLLGLAVRGENAYGSYARVLCRINTSAYRPGQTGA